MVTRDSSEAEIHNEMIRLMISHFMKQGYRNLRADLANETPPEHIGDFTPDLTCNKNDDKGTCIILEAETCSTILQKHTERQWRTFFNEAKERKCEFHLVVPKLCESDSGGNIANQRLTELHIKADAVWKANHSLGKSSRRDTTS
ncbi:MAG: hypothetical protein JSV87_02965 [Candidatus Bathyarchaeota archaeon]|nr:MAG: hypothetical protein JSV87_02965 [Candidatus Bathyarchaeota archaeon]